MKNQELAEMLKMQTATAVKRIIKKVDTDGDKKISIKEALKAMQNQIFKPCSVSERI